MPRNWTAERAGTQRLAVRHVVAIQGPQTRRQGCVIARLPNGMITKQAAEAIAGTSRTTWPKPISRRVLTSNKPTPGLGSSEGTVPNAMKSSDPVKGDLATQPRRYYSNRPTGANRRPRAQRKTREQIELLERVYRKMGARPYTREELAGRGVRSRALS